MEEEFEYGEEVMVRDHDTEEWTKGYYMMTAPNGNKPHWAVVFPLMKEWLDKERATWAQPFAQIRKIEKPEIKSPETSLTRKEESQLRGDVQWAIGQALAIGHREYGEIERSAKLLIEAKNELIRQMKETWTD